MHRWIEKCAEPPRGARSKRESIEKERCNNTVANVFLIFVHCRR